MEPKPRDLSCKEAAVAHTKIDGLLRLIAIISAFVFWYFTAIALLVLYVSRALSYSSLLSLSQAVSTAGLLPIPVALATWKVFEWAYETYLTSYAKKYFQP